MSCQSPDASSLEALHEKHLQSLTGVEQLEYLLNCQEYLKEEDVIGWKKSFAPEKQPEEPKKKRRRMSPDAVIWQPYPVCASCGSKDVIEDILEGSVVCTACGLIQVNQLIGMAAANMSYEQLKNGNRKTVHHYSRIVYFRSFLLALQGKTAPVVSHQELESLRVTLSGASCINEVQIVAALRKLKLAGRLRRHKFTLAKMINPDFKNIHIPAVDFFELLRLFRRVEYHYNWGTKKKLGKRRVFYSYPYVFYQLCFHMNKMEYTGTHHLLQDHTLLAKLHYAYAFTAFKAKLECDVKVYR